MKHSGYYYGNYRSVQAKKPNCADEISESEDEINSIPTKSHINATKAAQTPYTPPLSRLSNSGASSSQSTNPSRSGSLQQKFSTTQQRHIQKTAKTSSKISAAERKRLEDKERAHSSAPLKTYISRTGETLAGKPKGKAKGHQVPPSDLRALGAKNSNKEANRRSVSPKRAGSLSNASSFSTTKDSSGFDSLFAPQDSAIRSAKSFPLNDNTSVTLPQRSASSQASTSHIILPKRPITKLEVKPLPFEEINASPASYISRTPQSFPMDEESSSLHSSRAPQSFPMDDEPSQSYSSRVPRSFPLDGPNSSPPRSSQHSSQHFSQPSSIPNRKNSRKVSSQTYEASSPSSTTEADSPVRPGPMPFPLDSPARSIPSSGSKRAASTSPLYSSSPSRKLKLAKRFQLDHDFLDEDSIIVDPNTLCPFCDEPWPTHPTSKLLKLLSRAKVLSWPQPRHGNALGLKAEFENFKDVCTEHRMEGTVIPKGVERGWPTEIDFDAIPKRLKRLRSKLYQFVENPKRSKFFRDAMQDVKDIGALAAMSAQGQLAAFERSRPGYYGERGMIRISRTMNNLFPTITSNTAAFKPLDSMTFVTAVLVPECAVLLIKDDLNLSSDQEALRVLLDSQAFGVAAHPDRGEDDDMEIGEMGREMRERLERGRERLHKHLDEARETVNGGKGLNLKSKLNTDSNSDRRGKGKEREKANLSSSRSVSVSSTHSRSAAIDLTSSGDSNDDDDVEIEEPTPRPKNKKKRLLGRGFTSARPFSSQHSIPDLEQEVRTRRLHSRSVSVQSNESSSGKWSKNLREDGGFDFEISD